jgi:hypothetical protein
VELLQDIGGLADRQNFGIGRIINVDLSKINL